jgi:hypothetical protein
MALKIGSTALPGNAPPDRQPPKDAFAARVTSGSSKAKAKPMIQRGTDNVARWVKILLFGHTGTGKTYSIVGLLKAGLKIIVISTDLGGSGLSSVYNELKSQQRLDLWENIINIDFPDYDSLADFLRNPQETLPDFFDFDPDMLVWDGFSGYQQIHIQDKILNDIAPNTKNSSEGRTEGLWAEQQDWGMIRNATVRGLGNFLKLHNWKTGKALHKLMTCLESKPTADKLSGDVVRAPYVQGSAAALMGPSFDIIIETKVNTLGSLDGDKRQYVYNCVGHDKLLAKSRGFPLAATEPADMYTIWTTKIAPALNPAGAVEIIPEEEPNVEQQ